MSKIFHAKDGSFMVVADKISDNAFPIVVMFKGGSVGNIIENYPTEIEASRFAEQFRNMFEIAREEGYSLSDKRFVKGDKWVHVSNALDADQTPENFRKILKNNSTFA